MELGGLAEESRTHGVLEETSGVALSRSAPARKGPQEVRMQHRERTVDESGQPAG